MLGLGCGHHLAVAVEPGQAELQGGLGLQGAPLIHQLVALQRDLLLQDDRACIEIGGGFRQSEQLRGRHTSPWPAPPMRGNQLWQRDVEPAAGIAEQGDADGHQRQQVTARDEGGWTRRDLIPG